jgi:hypothetical protein
MNGGVMRKFGYMIIGAIFTLIISIGFLTFADSSNETDTYAEYEELLTSEPNELTAESVLEHQTVHVVNESTVVANASLNETIKEVESVETQEEDKVSFSSQESFLDQIEKLEVEIESDQTKIKIKQERKKKKVKSEVEVELKNEKMKLKDQRAEEFIKEVFSTFDVQATEDLQIIADELLAEFQMNPHAVEVEIKIEKIDGTKMKLEIDD